MVVIIEVLINFCITTQFYLKDSRKKKYKGHKSDNTADPARDGVHVQAEQEMIKMMMIMLLLMMIRGENELIWIDI